MTALAGTPVIETERLILRAPQSGDWPHWESAALAGDGRFDHIGGPFDGLTAWRALCHLTGHWVHRGFGMFIWRAKGDDTPLGMTGPWAPESWPEPEIGWTVWSAGAEGKGLAHEAAVAARAFAYQSLGWTTAVSYIAPGNTRSIRLAERLGCVLDRDAPGLPLKETQVWRHPGPEALA